MPDPQTRPRRLGRPPDRSGEETRRELLAAALEHFSRGGYAGTSVREIAESVGIRDSAIYGHFPSKRALYEEALESAEAHLLSAPGIDLDRLPDDPPSRILPELVDLLLRAWGRPRAMQFIGALVRDGLSEGPALLSDAVERLTPWFRSWTDSGRLRGDVPPEVLAWEFLAPLVTLRLLYFQGSTTTKDRRRAAELARRHAEFFLSSSTPLT
jgi:AcrR family transcriptional regulator